ncbi:MAG: HAD family phosphatase [Acidobacteriota bacterium]
MLRAIIFDCDGVIADTEPFHLAAFDRVLREEGIAITEEDYFANYLSLDDRSCFTRAFGERGRSLTQDQLNEMIGRKAEYVRQMMQAGLQIFPGAAEFIHRAAECYPLAIASGALRIEIELILEYGGLRDCFRVIVSSEDVARSKPNPDPFLEALDLLNALSGDPIKPGECLVIEDSIRGIRAAREAAMPCLAVSNTYPKEKLSEANRIVDSLAALSLKDVQSLFEA